jgi:hypothetical protein
MENKRENQYQVIRIRKTCYTPLVLIASNDREAVLIEYYKAIIDARQEAAGYDPVRCSQQNKAIEHQQGIAKIKRMFEL